MNFGNLIFTNPWILCGLIALPILWFILRITPPAPRRIILPTTRFLAGLIPARQTPSHTPWWILLLRMIIATLVFIAFSGPVFNPSAQLEGDGPLRLVIDNGWASAQTWDDEMREAKEILAQDTRANRTVYILTTAPEAGGENPLSQGPLAPEQAESLIKGLKPLPWLKDYAGAAKLIQKNPPADSLTTIWLSDGIDENGIDDFSAALRAQGDVSLFTPQAARLPILLRKPEKSAAGKIEMALAAPNNMPSKLVSVQASAEDGRIIDQESVTLKPGQITPVIFNTAESLRGSIARFHLSGQSGAGGTYILDERYRKKSVGIVGPDKESNPKPFVEARYYIERAIEPYATIAEGSADEILKINPAVMILPDIGALAPDTLTALESWVKNGGLLLRFAGPTMAAQDLNFLMPVPLRTGGRSLDGSMAWEKPQKLSTFPKTSPLYGITLHDDILVRRQLLADPNPDLESKTWASLDDDTPLITASKLDKGLLVLIHTSAESSWSDLPLSGAFVDILKRIASLAGAHDIQTNTNGNLGPLWVLDGFGQMTKPLASAQSIPAPAFDVTMPSSKHPPGLYGRAGRQRALNLGDHIEKIKSFDPPTGVTPKIYGHKHERNLTPIILFAAFALLLADWLIMMILSNGAFRLLRFAGIFILIGISLAHADPTPSDLKYANGFYLAYMRSGDANLDTLTQEGLQNLTTVLKNRTSVEPDGVVGLDPEKDNLIFFPLIYWPVAAAANDLSPAALHNIQNYLDHGGTILFDTRDQNSGDSGVNPNLRHLVGQLNIPPVAPIQKNHVILHSFYLLDDYPGRLNGGTLWAETQSAPGRDGVSSVLIGSNDWGGAWATGENIGAGGGEHQEEYAFRFGVNLVMYALTGNYKEDQVHVKSLLEKIGQ